MWCFKDQEAVKTQTEPKLQWDALCMLATEVDTFVYPLSLQKKRSYFSNTYLCAWEITLSKKQHVKCNIGTVHDWSFLSLVSASILIAADTGGYKLLHRR